MRKLLLVLLCTVVPALTQADEVWESTRGRVVYETDLAATAIWSYRSQYTVGLIHIAGLAGIYQNRGTYEAYWVQNNSKERCDTLRPTQNRATSPYWGRIHITFLDKKFPFRWEAKWSYCNEPMQQTLWKGQPVTRFSELTK
ncbi:MAG: hypothetical protein ACPG47_09890 [Leucothrix sp.]